jgi:hypothetical protein
MCIIDPSSSRARDAGTGDGFAAPSASKRRLSADVTAAL